VARLFAAFPPGFKRDSAHQYALMAGLVVAELLYTALLARALGPRGFGLIVMLLSVSRICQGLTDLRVHELVIRYAENARAADNGAALYATLRRALSLDLGSTLAGFALVVLIATVRPGLIPGTSEHQTLMILAAIATAAAWAGRFWSTGVLRLFHRVDRQAKIQLGGAFAKLILTGAWFTLFAASIEAVLVIATVCGGCAAAILVGAAMHVGRMEARQLQSDGPLSADLWVGWRAYIASNYGIGLLETAYRELDVQLIGRVGTLEQVSVYKLAKTFAGAVLQAVDPVILLLLPQFARDVAAERIGALRAFIYQVTVGFTAAGVVLGLSAHFAIPYILPLLVGGVYGAAVGVFQIIVWCLVITMPLLWTHALCMALGRPHLYLTASIAGVATLIALTPTLVPFLGAAGAAWAYGASQIVVAMLTFVLLVTHSRTPAGLLLR